MKRLRTLMFVLALVPALAVGADGPKGSGLIECPETMDAFKMIDAKVTGSWESAIWSIEPEAKVDWRTSADGKVYTFVAPPGTYTLRLVAADFTAKKLGQDKKVVVIGEAPLPPSPDPPEPPKPVPGTKYQLMFVVETATLDNLPDGQTNVLAGLKFRKQVFDKGHTILGFYDPSPEVRKTAPKEFVPWFEAADGKVPCILMAPLEGGPIVAKPMPANEDEFWKLVGGK